MGWATLLFVVLFVGFVAFRFVQSAQDMKAHPPKLAPGQKELRDAISAITGASHGTGRGNSPEAIKLAGDLSRALKEIDMSLFTGGDPDAIDVKLLNHGEFIVFCQLNEDTCAYVIHVPELRHYTSEAKQSLATLAYASACEVMDPALKARLRKLAVVTRGNILFDKVMIGEKGFTTKEPALFFKAIEHDGVVVPELYPFFAPAEARPATTP